MEKQRKSQSLKVFCFLFCVCEFCHCDKKLHQDKWMKVPLTRMLNENNTKKSIQKNRTSRYRDSLNGWLDYWLLNLLVWLSHVNAYYIRPVNVPPNRTAHLTTVAKQWTVSALCISRRKYTHGIIFPVSTRQYHQKLLMLWKKIHTNCIIWWMIFETFRARANVRLKWMYNCGVCAVHNLTIAWFEYC